MEKKKKKTPADINQLASFIVSQTTEDKQSIHAMNELPKEKNPAAVALGRLGGLKGGRARHDALTPERRKEIAREAAKTRWAKK